MTTAAFPALALCTYRTSSRSAWRDADFSAWQFVQAIKGVRVRGFGHVPVQGVHRHIENENRDDALEWFALMASEQIRGAGLLTGAPLHIVPIPSKEAVLGRAVPNQRVATVAARVADIVADGAEAWDGLRWVTDVQRARLGGPRDPFVLRGALTTIGPAPLGRIVLVDDVLTSGGHLAAAEALLRAMGGNVELALVAGRADGEVVADVFAVRSEEIGRIEVVT